MQNHARNNDRDSTELRINMVLIIQTTEEISNDATEQKEQQKNKKLEEKISCAFGKGGLVPKRQHALCHWHLQGGIQVDTASRGWHRVRQQQVSFWHLYSSKRPNEERKSVELSRTSLQLKPSINQCYLKMVTYPSFQEAQWCGRKQTAQNHNHLPVLCTTFSSCGCFSTDLFCSCQTENVTN